MRIPVGKDDSSFFGNSLILALLVGSVWFAGHAMTESSKTHMNIAVASAHK